MSLHPAIIEALVAAGVKSDAIAAACRAAHLLEQQEAAGRREREAERKRKYRASRMSQGQDGTTRDNAGQPTAPSAEPHQTDTNPAKNGSECPKQSESGSLLLPSSVEVSSEFQQRKEEQVEARDTVTAFDRFWEAYPNKVGKEAARKAFAKARKRVELSVLMAALARYAAKTDDRPWCNPATWLNQHRWEDRPSTGPPPRVNGHTVPRPGSREDRNERTANVVRSLDPSAYPRTHVAGGS